VAQWPEPGWYVPAEGSAAQWWDGRAWWSPEPIRAAAPAAPDPAAYADPLPTASASAGPSAGPGRAARRAPTQQPASARRPWRSPVVLGAAAVGATLALASGLVAAGVVGSKADPDGPPPSLAAMAATSSTPVFRPSAPATQGYTGFAEIFRAAGKGTWTSPAVSLSGGHLQGMTQKRKGKSVVVTIEPVLESDDPRTHVRIPCEPTGAECGWGGTAPLWGKYRVTVTAPAGTSWSVMVRQQPKGADWPPPPKPQQPSA